MRIGRRATAAIRAAMLALPLLSCTAAPAGQPAPAESARAGGTFEIDDYFRLVRVTELALSSDARWLAYALETHSGESDERVRRVYLRSLAAGARERALDPLSDARELAWIAGTHELAFLSDRAGPTQLFSYNVETGNVRQRTRSADGIERFLFAGDGSSLAYATRAQPEPGASLYEQFRRGEAGILIDSDTTSSHDFVNPHWQRMAKPPPLALWTATDESAPVRVPVPGELSADEHAFLWSSDARLLSVTYVGGDMPPSQLSDERTSLGVFDAAAGSFRALARAVAPTDGKAGTSFKGGEWLPGEQRVLVRRVTEIDPWVSGSHPEWATASVSGALPQATSAWHPLEVYPRGLKFLPLDATRILLANTVKGVHSLFVLKPGGIERSELLDGLDGSSSHFQFGADLSTLAFVNESLARPPEIYVRRGAAPVRRLTDLNGDIARKIEYRAREVSWTGPDGIVLHGWLLEPPTSRPPGGWPLITHVHGGPAFPFPDAFAPYFGYWSYPLEIYAARGMAVFMPNYRGTHTYGRRIATPATNQEPMDDIIAGVRSLVAAGVADATRLGISGHSHGAVLGPLAMARAKMFRASSFAEGVANGVVMYELMSEDANREIHDPIIGASLYDEPQRYLEESPDLQFAGVSTASLFEAGSYTSALLMLGFPKAARRAGMPAEFIVYPQTGHNLAIPRLQREAAGRNLDWFDFWLNDRESPDPRKAQQYLRWRLLAAPTAAALRGQHRGRARRR